MWLSDVNCSLGDQSLLDCFFLSPPTCAASAVAVNCSNERELVLR
jgi:hypothetical protein